MGECDLKIPQNRIEFCIYHSLGDALAREVGEDYMESEDYVDYEDYLENSMGYGMNRIILVCYKVGFVIGV